MLAITRRPSESVFIGDDIEVRIVAIHGEKVRVGIVAPRDVKILRGELVNDDERDVRCVREAEMRQPGDQRSAGREFSTEAGTGILSA